MCTKEAQDNIISFHFEILDPLGVIPMSLIIVASNCGPNHHHQHFILPSLIFLAEYLTTLRCDIMLYSHPKSHHDVCFISRQPLLKELEEFAFKGIPDVSQVNQSQPDKAKADNMVSV